MASKFSRIEHYEPKSSSKWLTETVAGSHQFKIEGDSFNRRIGNGKFIESDVFTVGGYECVIKYYPHGSNPPIFKKSTYLTFALDLKSGKKKVQARVEFNLLYNNGNPSNWSQIGMCTYYRRNFSKYQEWNINRTTLQEAIDHFKDDSFTILCFVTVLKQTRLASDRLKSIAVPPSNLNRHLGFLLEGGKGADVVFQVRGETFNVHKCILAARSPVFNAQFFGPMNDNGEKNIKCDDIEPGVFRVLLQFIYSDSLPEMKGDVRKQDNYAMYQHLFVAADRYEVERLKIICANMLCENIAVNNVATTLTLAEQHNCPEIKASCLKFVSSDKILAAIMETDGFEHLTQSCPFILKELVENMTKDN